MTSGILLLNKSQGITSNQCIQSVKKKLKLKKIGHAGTLDPLASGLLVCFTDRATKLAHYAEKQDKSYTGTVLLGTSTDTDDLEGEVVAKKEVPEIDQDQLETIIQKNFIGEIKQLPPKYSALKVQGKRAYDLARKGESFELKSRLVNISQFEISSLSPTEFDFCVTCSTGTYIRSIARDIGQIIGCGACLKKLERTEVGQFSLMSASDIDSVSEKDILNWHELFPKVARLDLNLNQAERMSRGCQETLKAITQTKKDPFLIYQYQEQPLGLLKNNANKWMFAFNME